ncbi:MAG: metal-sensitive transcriptional regulator [Candidatus Dormibacteria bacterium]|nr:metal-sensitive transcriptional regulator [Candidatus Saccharimonadales bacterium]
MTTEQFSEQDKMDITSRLRRIEGQIRGLQRMVDDERDCVEIVQQLAAARAALDRAGSVMLASGLRCCLAETKLDRRTQDRVETTLGALVALRT